MMSLNEMMVCLNAWFALQICVIVGSVRGPSPAQHLAGWLAGWMPYCMAVMGLLKVHSKGSYIYRLIFLSSTFT